MQVSKSTAAAAGVAAAAAAAARKAQANARAVDNRGPGRVILRFFRDFVCVAER